MPELTMLTTELASDLIDMRRAWRRGTLDPSRGQPRPTRKDASPQRWLPVKNTESSLEIPAFACVEVVDITDEGGDNPNATINVRRPAGGGSSIYMFVGNEPIEKNGGFGVATFDLPTWALYKDADGSASDVDGANVHPDDVSFGVSNNHYGPATTEVFQGQTWKSLGSVVDGNGSERLWIVNSTSMPWAHLTGSKSAESTIGDYNLSIGLTSRANCVEPSGSPTDEAFWLYDSSTQVFTCQRSGFFHLHGACILDCGGGQATVTVSGGAETANISGGSNYSTAYTEINAADAYGGSNTGRNASFQMNGITKQVTSYINGFIAARPAGAWGDATTFSIRMVLGSPIGGTPAVVADSGVYMLARVDI